MKVPKSTLYCSLYLIVLPVTASGKALHDLSHLWVTLLHEVGFERLGFPSLVSKRLYYIHYIKHYCQKCFLICYYEAKKAAVKSLLWLMQPMQYIVCDLEEQLKHILFYFYISMVSKYDFLFIFLFNFYHQKWKLIAFIDQIWRIGESARQLQHQWV